MRPDEVATREDLARALALIREESGLSIREVAARADAIAGTVSGWFTGKHAPTAANQAVFAQVLTVCGVTDADEQGAWIAAAARARRPVPRKPPAAPAPYRGFDAFGVDDGAWFFGRADITERLVATVLDQADNPTATIIGNERTPVITIVGPSGAGKSSVVRAGLLAMVGQPGPFERWRYAVCTPGLHAVESLRAALAALPAGEGPVIVVVDQLEEFWTTAESAALRWEFGDVLLGFGDTVEKLVVVQAIRADFYGALAASPRLARALQNAHILVPALSEQQLHEVILGPAGLAGIEVADDLIDLLMTDLQPAGARAVYSGSLPLLSHALLSTWSVSDKRRLTVQNYLATGRIQGAVEQTAERVYSELDYAAKVVARRQLLAMTHVDEELSSRRRVQLDELGVVTDDPDAKHDVRQRRSAEVLGRFAAARMVTVAETYAEVTHETLFSAWPRLAGWIDEDRADLMVHRRLRTAITMWEESDRSADLLPRGGRLQAFNEFAANPENLSRMPESEQRFLELSNERENRAQSEERRRARILRVVAVAATVFAVVALVAATIAVVTRSGAVDQQRTAELLRRDALSAQLAVQADQVRPTDPALAMQMAMSAFRIAPTVEARSSLIDGTSQPVPVRHFTAEGPGKAVRSPDGSMIAVINSDNKIRLYATGGRGIDRRIAEFGGKQPDGSLYAAAFSPDSRVLYTAGVGAPVSWDLTDRSRPRQVAGAPAVSEVVRDMTISPDGQLLLMALDGGGVRAFTRSSPAGGAQGMGRQTLASIPVWAPVAGPGGPTGDGKVVAFSRDGRLLAIGRNTTAVDIFRTVGTSFTRISTISLPGAANIAALGATFSPSGDMALALKSRDVKVYSLADPTRPVQTRNFTGFTSYVNSVEYSADGRYLLAASSDNSSRVIDTTGVDGDEVLRSGAVVDSAVFAGGHVVSVSEDGAVKVWPPQRPTVQAGVAATFQFAFDAQGSNFISYNAAPDGSVSQWSLAPGPTLVRRGPLLAAPPGQKYSSLSYSGDGRLGVFGSADGSVYFGDLADPSRPRLTGPGVRVLPGLVESVDISTRSHLAVAGSLDSTEIPVVDIADPAAPRVVSRIQVGGGVAWLFLTSDGRRLVVTNPSGTVVLYDLSNPAAPTMLFRQKLFESGALAARFSPDEKQLVVTSSTKEVKVVDISTPRSPVVTATMTGPSSTIYGGAFSRDGKTVVAGSADGEVWLWDVTRRGHPERVARLRSYPGRIYDVQFGRDDETVLATGATGAIASWSIDPRVIEASVCGSGTALLTLDEWNRFLPRARYVSPCP